MKIFKYNFYSEWGGDSFELFTVMFLATQMKTWFKITVFNFTISFDFRTKKQEKAQRIFNKRLTKDLHKAIDELKSQETKNKKTKKINKKK